MERMPKYVMISTVAVAWVCVLTAVNVCAQNFSGIVPGGNPEATAPAQNQVRSRNSISSPAMPYSNAVEEYSTKAAKGGVPDFIMESSYYTLGKDDVIDIEVLRHPEVSGQYMINSEGKIQYEFIGDVKIEGLKKDGVKGLLTKLLSEYIISPVVTVKITGYNSKIVYVIGEVGRPGKIFMRGDTITVREALVQAGLPMLSAKAAKCHLITPSADGKPADKRVNVQKLLYEGDLRENFVMKPGDTLYVPPTFLAKTMRVLQPVTAPINEVGGVAGTAYGF